MLDIARSTKTHLTLDPAIDSRAIWSPEGKEVAFCFFLPVLHFISLSVMAVACSAVNRSLPLSARSNSSFPHLDRMMPVRECSIDCNSRCPSSWAMACPKMIPAGTPLLSAIFFDLSQRTTAWLERANGKANPREASVAMPGLVIDAVLTTTSQS